MLTEDKQGITRLQLAKSRIRDVLKNKNPFFPNESAAMIGHTKNTGSMWALSRYQYTVDQSDAQSSVDVQNRNG